MGSAEADVIDLTGSGDDEPAAPPSPHGAAAAGAAGGPCDPHLAASLALVRRLQAEADAEAAAAAALGAAGGGAAAAAPPSGSKRPRAAEAGGPDPPFVADGLGFRLARVEGGPNRGAVSLADLCGARLAGDLRWVVLSTFTLDTRWLFAACAHLARVPSLVILVHHRPGAEGEEPGGFARCQAELRAAHPNARLCAPSVEAAGGSRYTQKRVAPWPSLRAAGGLALTLVWPSSPG